MLGLLVGILSIAGPGASVALAEDVASSEGAVLSGSLVVPGSPSEGEQVAATRAAELASPGSISRLEESQTKFDGVSSTQAAHIAAESFPSEIEHAGTPALPANATLDDYLSPTAAQITLANGQSSIVEASLPMATASANGGDFRSVDLKLHAASLGYEPANPLVGVRIPNDLGEGAGLSNHIALVPIDTNGDPFSDASPGELDGAGVYYGEVGEQSGTFVKPTATGLAVNAILFSSASPRTLRYRVDVPAEASLIQPAANGPIQLVQAGVVIAEVLPPAAEDAAGREVPVTMTLTGHTVTLEVAGAPSEDQFPINVDPEITDSQLWTTVAGKRSNWEFYTSNASAFGKEAFYESNSNQYLRTKAIGEYKGSEYAYWGYETKGVSKIWEVTGETEAANTGGHIESFLELRSASGKENKELLSAEVEKTAEYSRRPFPKPLCPKEGEVERCVAGAGGAKNAIHFQQSTTASGSSFKDTLYQATVAIAEPEGTHATASFNTTEKELEFEAEVEGKKEKRKQPNALYGSGSWLSNYDGALKPEATDPGIGVAKTKLEYEYGTGKWEVVGEHNYLEAENDCQGVQCYATHSEYWTLNSHLANGEDKIRYRAEEAIAGTQSLEAEGIATVKVDRSAPRDLKVLGLPYGNELSERPYELTVQATDGEGEAIPSSGVKSIAFYVDGKEVGEPSGSCSTPKGECTAGAKWTINGAELGAGRHSIEVVALDNAGNEARHYEPLTIRHSTPVTLGPGDVDLESGDFTLGASDVSMGSGLTVSRNYSSRATEQGAAGALGPEWTLSLANTEQLEEMVDGSLLLTGGNGNQSIFAKTESTTYESPVGDSNLALTVEENKEKEKTAFYLKNATDHTTVKFTRPSGGTRVWVPTVQEGAVSTDTVTYSYKTEAQHNEYPLPGGSTPVGITSGSDGNVWFANYGTDKIGRITGTGTVTEYSVPGSELQAITTGSDGNVWFSEGKKIGKMSTTGAILAEYKVSGAITDMVLGNEGDVWFVSSLGKIGKVTPTGGVTEYSLPTEDVTLELTVGPEGNIWFTNFVCAVNHAKVCKIGKMTTTGSVSEYAIGTPEHSVIPFGIAAGADKDLWFTGHTESTSEIGKITTSGEITAQYSLPAASDPNEIMSGPDGALWFVDPETSKIGRITTAGAVSEFALPEKSRPEWLTTGPDGDIWFSESSGNIGTMTPAGVATLPSEALAPVPAGVSCSPEMHPGCRALKFKYASNTTAAGVGEAEWGEYKGRLAKIVLATYNPSTAKMEEPTVAEYAYDDLGRLRAEWDPRLSSPLKTTYGYDEGGHVTALNPAGEESWAMSYGTADGDAGNGRLMKITRAAAAAELWRGEAVKSTEAPAISGSVAVGVRLAVSNGKWSGGPLAYSYQWESCSSSGANCSAVIGATNANYIPTAGEVGHTLFAIVTATNGSGSVAARTALTATVPPLSFTQAIDSGNSVNAASCIAGTSDCVVSDSKGNAYWSSNVSAVEGATWNKWTGPSEQSPSQAVDCPSSALCLLADGKEAAGGRLYYSTIGLGTSFTQAYSPVYGVDAIACASTSLCVAGQDGDGYYRYSTNPASSEWTLEEQGSAAIRATYCLSTSFCALADSAGNVHIATSTSQIKSSSWKETDVDGSTALNGIACTTTTSCVAVDGAGNVLNLAVETSGAAKATKHDLDGTNNLTAVTCTGGTCVAVDNVGNVFVSSNSGETWSDAHQLSDKLTSVTCASTSLCITADTTGNVTSFNPHPTYTEGELHSAEPGSTIDYAVPVTGASAPHNMSESETARWGQTDNPVEATAVFPEDAPEGWPAASYTRATIYYLDEQGRTVNTAQPGGGENGAISTTEYNEYNDIIRTLTPDNRLTALEAGGKSPEVAKLLDTESTYNGEGAKEGEVIEPGTRLIETLGPQHTVKYVAGHETKEAKARLHTKYFYEDKEGEEATHERYDLLTKTTTLAQLANEEEVEVRKTTESYSGQGGIGWKLRAPTSTTTDPEGLKLTTTTVYNETTGQIIERRAPKGVAGESAHDQQIIYYGSEANKEVAGCGKHAEWAGLVCETRPAKQPTTGPAPKLPETVTTYNEWDEPETVEENYGGAIRKKIYQYDELGRLKTSEVKASGEDEKKLSTGKTLPAVTDTYNKTNGLLETEAATIEGEAKTTTSVYNTLGELETYTDAAGNKTTYKYGGSTIDGQIEEVSDSNPMGGSSQKYSYDETTKQMTKLIDSAAGTFTATYDAEGNLSTEVYPNAMCAKYSRNANQEPVALEYVKTANCNEAGQPVWYSQTIVPSVRGEMLTQTTTLASESYTYDTAGRLTEAQETPAGSYCKTRVYAYDEESNRTNLTTREPNAKKECATEGGTEQKHTYDEANRLTDAGVEYDAFGDITQLPASDAEGQEVATKYYVDGAVASQTQSGVTNEYTLDPGGRTFRTKSAERTTTSYYDGFGEAVSWTSESASKWTRQIPGIDGALAAVQTNGGLPELQLHDLQGDIVATAAVGASETKLLGTYNSTEFGVPSGKEPPKYAWLGAGDISRTTSTGVVTYGATSYVPQIGRALQSEEVVPPGLSGGSGGGGAYISQEEPWNLQGAAEEAREAPGLEAGRGREAAEAAYEAALACGEAGVCGVDPPTLVLESRAGVESLLKDLELGDGIQSTIAELLDTPVTDVASFVVSNWVSFFERSLDGCLSKIGPASRHGGCLLEFKRTEVEFENPWGEWDTLEFYNGEFNVYACHKQHGTPQKNLLVCPTGHEFWYVFSGR